jgi:hypothetical protein
MLLEHSNDEAIHVSNSFTELFHVLKKINKNDFTLNYSSIEMNALLMHADNAITSVLHGLQAIGNLLASSTLAEKGDIEHIGYFLTAMGNLMEALNILRKECEEQLITMNNEHSIIEEDLVNTIL